MAETSMRERVAEAERQAFEEHEAPSWEADPEARDAAIRWHLRGFNAGVALIEEAVTAERERCARIAGDRAHTAPGTDEYTSGWASGARTIAAAIRGGESE